MATGALTNADAVTAIGTSYAANKLITLATPLVGDVGLGPVVDRITVYFAANGGASTTLKGTLYWDVAGDYKALAEFTFTRTPGLTTAAIITGEATLSQRLLPMSPHATAHGTLYLGLIVDANAIDVGINGVELRTRDDLTAQG